MNALKTCFLSLTTICLRFWAYILKHVFHITIPNAPERLLSWLFNNNRLAILEYLSDVYFSHGIFRFDKKLYLLEPKLSLKAVNKLDKGAVDYLPNSPLKSSFLAATEKSPDVRHVIAAMFRKPTIEEKGALMHGTIEKVISKMADTDKANLSDLMLKMALDIVGKVLLGIDLHALEGKQDRLLHAMMTILHRSFALGQVPPDSQEFAESNQMLDKLTNAILCESLDKAEGEDNFVHQLVKAGGVDEAKSNLKLFLMAGSETTASSLPVMLYILSGMSDLQRELQEEADEWIDRIKSDASQSPPKLESALKELLRTYAIAPYISRRTETELCLGRITIPAKSDLRIFMWGMHRSPHIWDDSKLYRPDRFLLPNTINQTRQHGLWIPFGAGSRICIGQHLAWAEMRLALTYFLHHFNFKRIPQTKDLEFCVDWEHSVVHPDVDVVLGVEKR